MRKGPHLAEHLTPPIKSLLLLFVAVILIYWRGLSGDFVWDDRLFFIDNDILPALGPLDLKAVLLRPVTHWGDHMPLTNYLFVLEYTAFGLRTTGYHLVSLALYLLTGLAVWRMLGRLMPLLVKEPARQSQAALLITALFMLSPVHVEPVAYITGQKDLMYGLWSVLALYFLLGSFGPEGRLKGWRSLALTVLCYYLSLLSKPAAVANALFLPAFWLIHIRPKGGPLLRPLGFWALVNLPGLAWLFYSLIGGGTLMRAALGAPGRLALSLKSLGAHTALLLWPWPLNFGYPFGDTSGLEAEFVLGVIVVALTLYMLVMRGRSALTLALLGIVVYLTPVLQIFVPFSNAMVFDRYLYIPALWFALALWQGYEWAASGKAALKRAAALLLAVLLALWMVIAWHYVPKFESDVASLRHGYAQYPGWKRVAFDYVYALIEDRQLALAAELTEREPTFGEPEWVRPYFRGWIALEEGRPEDALGPLMSAAYLTEVGAYFPFAHVHLGRAYGLLGQEARARAALLRLMPEERRNPLEYYKALVLLRRMEAKQGAGGLKK